MLKVSDIIVIYRETFKLIKYSVPLIASIIDPTGHGRAPIAVFSHVSDNRET